MIQLKLVNKIMELKKDVYDHLQQDLYTAHLLILLWEVWNKIINYIILQWIYRKMLSIVEKNLLI